MLPKHIFNKKKGIVIVTTMLFTVIIVMLVAVLTTSSLNTLNVASFYNDSERASLAALSGLEYVRFRIAQDPETEYGGTSWMQGKKGGCNYSKEFACLSVMESDGVVIGTINPQKEGNAYLDPHKNRDASKFIIAFVNPDDETKMADSRKGVSFLHQTPVSALPGADKDVASLKYLSCNNLKRGSASRVLMLDGTYRYYKEVPPNSCYIIVKGVAGRNVKYLKAYLKPNGDFGSSDASTVAREKINISLAGDNAQCLISSRSGNNLIRSKNIDIYSWVQNCNAFSFGHQGGTAYAEKIYLNQPHTYKKDTMDLSKWILLDPGSNIKGDVGYDYNINSKADVEDFIKNKSGLDEINWRSINEDIEYPDKNRIPKGAYLYDTVDSKWKHYTIKALRKDSDSAGIVTVTLEKGALTSIPSSDAFSFTTSDVDNKKIPSLEINENVRCHGNLYVGAVDGVPEGKMFVLSNKDLSANVKPSLHLKENSVLRIDKSLFKRHDIIFQGNISGSGSLYSRGNVFIQGGSYFDSRRYARASIYAVNDINIMPSTGLRLGEKFNQQCSHAWSNFYKSQTTRPYTDLSVASEALLKSSTGNGKLSDLLASMGCTGADQNRFAESFIIKNSAWVGGDSSVTPSSHSPSLPWNNTSKPLPHNVKYKVSPPQYSVYYGDGNPPDKGSGAKITGQTLLPDNADGVVALSINRGGNGRGGYLVPNKSGTDVYLNGTGTDVHLNDTGTDVHLNAMKSVKSDDFLQIWLHSSNPLGLSATEEAQDKDGTPGDLLLIVDFNLDTPKLYTYVGFNIEGRSQSSPDSHVYKNLYYKGVVYKEYQYDPATKSFFNVTNGVSENILQNCDESNNKKININLKSVIDNLALEANSSNIDDTVKGHLLHTISSFSSALEGADSLPKFTGVQEPLTDDDDSEDTSDDDPEEDVDNDINNNETPATNTLAPSDGFIPNSYIRNSKAGSYDFTFFYPSGNIPVDTISRYVPEDTIDPALYSPNSQRYLVLNRTPSLYENSLPEINDTLLKGMIFARRGDFNANIGNGVLTIIGGVVAYKGMINVRASSVNFHYDPDYMFFGEMGKSAILTPSFCIVTNK